MNELMNTVNTSIDGRVCVSDWLYYIMSLFQLVKDDIKVYAEIGTLWGGSAGMVLNLANADTEVFCIDLFNGYYNKQTVEKDWNKCSISINGKNHLDFVKKNLHKLNANKNKINYLKGSSYDEKTVSAFGSYNKKIDFLFIDGDHSDTGVINDFLMYKNFLSSNGIICFDNYGGTAWPGVKKGLDTLDFVEQGFNIIGEFSGKESGCLIIQRIK
jgi:predicted O-methyltransferase YrrM